MRYQKYFLLSIMSEKLSSNDVTFAIKDDSQVGINCICEK
jgi:hypothetical protein